MVKRILGKLEADELKDLAKFFMDIAKGVLGAPLVIYLVSSFPLLVLAIVAVVNFILALGFISLSFYFKRYSKRIVKNYG